MKMTLNPAAHDLKNLESDERRRHYEQIGLGADYVKRFLR